MGDSIPGSGVVLTRGNQLKLHVIAAALALAATGAGSAWAAPGFFTGVTEEPANLGAIRPGVQDLKLPAVKVWVEWLPAQTAPNAEQIGTVSSLVALGARPVLALGSSGANVPLTPGQRNDYCTFVRSLLQRFPTVKDVIIWNEPNKTANWVPQFHPSGTSAAPGAYVELLARCWDVLHAFRADVNVIGPATAPRGNDNPDAVSNVSHSPLTFVKRMGDAYRASGRTQRIFDTFAHHAYGSSSRERPWRTHAHFSQLSQGDWHRTMDALSTAFSGTGQAIPGQCRPGGCVWIWYTEAGYQTSPDAAKIAHYVGTEDALTVPDFAGGEPDSPPPDVTTPAPDQATQIVDGVRLAYCQPYVQAFFNFLLVDNRALNGKWQSGFFWADGTPKDSYPAFKRVIAETSARRVDCSRLKGAAPRPDTTAPATPGPIRLGAGDKRVALDWPDSAEIDVMGYHVFRASRRAGPYRKITEVPVPVSAYVDRGLRNRTTYVYAVSAVDTSENQSPRSAAGCATPRLAREGYQPVRYLVRPGRVVGRRGVSRVRANDGIRLAIRGRPAVATFSLRLPACHSPIRTIWVDSNGQAPTGAALLVFDRLEGEWRTAGNLRQGTRDRSVRWTSRRAERFVTRGGEVRFRVRGAQVAIDWVRLGASY